jgi:hypothetical protein
MTDKEALKLALEALEHCKEVIIERGLGGNPEFAQKWGLTLPIERSEKAITAIKQVLAAQQEHEPENEPFVSLASVQEPVAWVTVEDGKWISTRSADFRHITDGQYQLYVGPLAYEVPAAIKTLEALGYIYEEGEQWTAPPAAQPAPVQEMHRYSPNGEGGMELDSLGAYVKLQDVTTPPQNHV